MGVCASALVVAALTLTAGARDAAAQRKYRVTIDSQPQQAAIYVNQKESGIQGYTPTTLKLPKGAQTIILELPGFKPVQRPINVTRSEKFIFTLERQARPSVLDVRSVSSDSASGGQLFVDGMPAGTVPMRAEVAQGRHLVEVKKAGFKDYREPVDLAEGETRTLVIDLQAEAKKGSILVTADVAGADVFIDGQRRDAAPALIGDLAEGAHTVEVRKDPLQPWKQVVTVVGNQQTKVEAKLAPAPETQKGSLRVVSSTVGAEVFVDGEPRGSVNQEIKDLRPGQHIVEVRKEGFAPQVVEVQVVPGEQRLARLDLVPAQQVPKSAALRVVTPVPDAEVFIDGASVGKAPVDRNDLTPGKHYVVVRRQGYAEWKREVNLDPAQPTVVTAELSASGSLKVLSNVAGADVYIDGVVVGKTPLQLDTISAGEHLVEVKKTGYVPARQPFRVDGGEAKILSAELAVVQTGPTATDVARQWRAMSSFSAVTVDPGRFTADIAAGFFPFAQLRLTVGALRRGMLGLDAGVELRTTGYLTSGGAHAKFQWLKAGPAAIGVDLYLGGGGGPVRRSTFEFELGIPVSLLFGEIVRFTAKPYIQVYTDRNCPSVDDKRAEPMIGEEPVCSVYDTPGNVQMRRADTDVSTISVGGQSIAGTVKELAGGQDPRERYAGFRFMLQAALEIAVHKYATVFIIFEGDPVGQRQAYRQRFSAAYRWNADPQIYGRLGVTFKF